MADKFCSQCGNPVSPGNAFCAFCGAAQNSQPPQTQAAQPQPVQQTQAAPVPQPQPVQQVQAAPVPQPQPVQQTQAAPVPQPQPVQQVQAAPVPQPQPVQQAYYQPQPAYQPPRAASPQPYARPVTTARATGLIMGVFSLVVAALLFAFIFIIPSKEDFALLAMGEAAEAVLPSAEAPVQEVPAEQPAEEYGAVPAWVLENINTGAVEEDYYGSYTGTVSFRSENLEVMAEMTGDTSYEDIIGKYNGKTYDCTAEVEEDLRAFSPEIYSENSDGSFYVNYSYGFGLENGASIYEDGEYDEEMACTVWMAENMYFLNDGRIYAISAVVADFDDGRTVASELCLELTPNP